MSEGDAVKPMSDQRRPEPDTTALDELRKAFGVEAAAEADRGDATGAATAAHATPAGPLPPDEPDESPVSDVSDDAEQPEGPKQPDQADPADAADKAGKAGEADEATVPAPAVIRIDDYAGAPDAPPFSPPGEPLVAARAAKSGTAAERAVISIEADDLPDAVYVEGSLEGDRSRSIVFIEDDIESDALTPESDRDLRRGIEPRMRERRLAVKRAKGRKRLKWLVALLVVVILAVALLATFGSSLFAIRADEVTITGNVYTDPDQLQAVVDDLVGTPVLVADTRRAELDLEAIPWVEDAKVTTHFPHGVTIEIREREAVATYQGPDSLFRVLDRNGRVLDVIEGFPIAYVLITGPDPVDLDPSEVAPQGYQGAAELAKNLTGVVRGHVEQLEVTANGSRLVMHLDDGSEVNFGEARDLFTKLVRLETVLSQNPEREPGPIDVSTSQTTL